MVNSIWKMAMAGGLMGASLMAQADTIRFAHVDPDSWQNSKKGAAAAMFKAAVESRSDDLKVELYPAGALGGEDETVQQAMDGMTQVVMVSGAMSKVCPAAGVLDIPYMFTTASQAWQVLDGDFGDALAQHCLDQTGLRTLGYGETGFRNFTNNDHPIHSPADMKGLKFRVQDIPLYVELVKSLGGEPAPIPWSETPTALSTGVVDGQENPVSAIYNNNFHELQKYMTLDRHVYATDFLLINEQYFQSLSPEDQAIVEEAGKLAGNMGRSIQEFTAANGLLAVQEAGMEVYTPTPEELEQFRDKAQPSIIRLLRNDLGDEANWIDRLQQAVDSTTQQDAS